MLLFSWFPLVDSANELADVSPQFETNMAILWHAPTNQLPTHFWLYKKVPQIFSATAISNGIALASFEKKGFPKPSTNDIVLWADPSVGEPQPPHFLVSSKSGQMSFTLGDRAPDSQEGVARDEAAVKHALKCATELGANPAELERTNSAPEGVRGVFLTRLLDGMPFLFNNEGFQIQFEKSGRVRQFALLWPRLQRQQYCLAANPSEIMRCIRR